MAKLTCGVCNKATQVFRLSGEKVDRLCRHNGTDGKMCPTSHMEVTLAPPQVEPQGELSLSDAVQPEQVPNVRVLQKEIFQIADDLKKLPGKTSYDMATLYHVQQMLSLAGSFLQSMAMQEG